MGQLRAMKKEKFEEPVKEDSQAKLEKHPRGKPGPEEMNLEELLNKVEELQESAQKNFDLYIRSQAEIDNLKKRFQKEKEELAKFSNELLIKQLLTVVDNLENAIAHSEDENSLPALREGVKLTLEGLMGILKGSGLEGVKAANEPFDPNFHEAISGQEDDTVKPGTVLQEFQKGYILNQRLIRPAMVIVSRSKESKEK